jgi:UDP-N-acetylmuramate: L-alanyl-gamma-D-glutamyl-meso-diaminopimelate ligase
MGITDESGGQKRAYFLGIAGAGMSALASILKSEGWEVSGSDQDVFPPVSTYLDSLAIPWRDGFDAAAIPEGLDAVIVGSSAKLDLAHNPELAELKRRGAPIWSFPAFLGDHTAARETVVVAGSFGKSTVTALLAHLARAAGRDPGYFIGAVPLDMADTGWAGHDPEFFMEGDEYIVGCDDRRSKFLLYHPRAALITSLIHDHINVFPTIESYEAPFAELIARLPPEAPLVMAYPFPTLRRLAGDRAVVWYGAAQAPGVDYFAENIVIGEVTRFDLVRPGGDRIPLETELLGLHNIENIVGAAALLLARGAIETEALQRGVRGFHGLERRLDRKTKTSRVPVYEGFGSSYEKARSAIEAVRLHFPTRPLVVVFEPHTFSWRNAQALDWYARVFEGVDRVILLPPPTHGAQGHAQLTPENILTAVQAVGVAAELAAGGAAVMARLEALLTGAEVVLLLSSGPLDGLPQSLPPRLDARWGT